MNEPNYGKEKPLYLYKGVIINYETLQSFNFSGVDLVPPHPPVIDSQRRKTVGDGNEYGVYMTDHENVARNAYGKVSLSDGTPLNRNIMFGYDKSSTVIPSVGIVYKIDTNGLDTHIPWITSHLKGHYNNGMGGDEWISEVVPASNYVVDTVTLGADTLHEPENISVENQEELKKVILDKIAKRRERLELFEKKIESFSERDRYLLDQSKINVLKSIYKLNGIMDIDINNFAPNTPNDYLDYLMAMTYSKDKDNIDFATMSYIQSLKEKIKQQSDVSLDSIIELIQNDIAINETKKTEFLNKNVGKDVSTTHFDKKNERYNEILNSLNNAINKSANSNIQKTSEDYLAEYTEKLNELRTKYGQVAKEIEDLMIRNSQSPITNYQQQLDLLLQQRDLINDQIAPLMHGQQLHQDAINRKKEEEHNNIISQVERLLNTRVTSTAGYEYDQQLKAPQTLLKDTSTLRQEQGRINQQLDELYHDGQIDHKVWQSMKKEIRIEYDKMIASAPKPINQTQVNIPQNGEVQNTQQNTQEPSSVNKEETVEKIEDIPEKFASAYDRVYDSELIESMREKYGYADMSEEEQERFDEQLQKSMKEMKAEETVEEKKSAAELRREAWEKIRTQYFSNPKLDLEAIIRLQEFNEMQREEIEQVEQVNVEGHRRGMF